MVGYSKDFGYLLQENNVIGGVANGVDQIYGVMIMKCKLCEQVHSTKKISVKKYADLVMNHYYFDKEPELAKIIEHHNFELDSFLDIMVEDLNRYKEYVLVNIDGLTLQKRVHGTRYKIETNDAMNRDILRYWLWKWIRPRTKYKKLKPSLWNHLKRSGKGFELGLAQGCIPEWWGIK